MKKIKSILIAALLSSSAVFAQGVADALRLSQTETGGTARYMSMGGAFSALGADFSSLSTNPAGIAAYRSSEFTFTPTLYQNKTESNYIGAYGSDSKTNFNFNNIGYVGTTQTGKTTGVISYSFGLGYNRIKNYSKNYYVQNSSLSGSYSDNFAENFTDLYYSVGDNRYENSSTWPEPAYWNGTMAWDAGIIDYNPSTDTYKSVIQDENINQRNSIYERGKIDEYLLSMGMNLNHKVLLGASIAIQDIYFKYQKIADEDFSNYQGYTFTDNYKMNAYGFNFKIGAIFLPTEDLRLAMAIHTPTFINIDEHYSSDITNVALNVTYDYDNSYSPAGSFSYDLQTPFRYTFGGAYIIERRAILSVDYELADYSTMKYSIDGATHEFTTTNQDIDYLLDLAHTIRTGVEFRVTPEFSLRAGYAQIGTPYKNSYDLSSASGSMIKDAFLNPVGAGPDYIPVMTMPQELHNYSIGFGYRTKEFFFDAAYIRSDQDIDYLISYTPVYPEISGDPVSSIPFVADISSKTNRFMVTVGLKF